MNSQPATSTTQEDGYSEYTPRKRRRTRSKVWDELELGVNDKGERLATCKHCGIKLTAHEASGTSHLQRHLDRCKDRPVELRHTNDNDFVFDMSELLVEILRYIAEGNHSFLTVEEEGFRRMMTKCNPKFVPFGRATAKRDLLTLYVSEREKLHGVLSKVSRVCLTTDNWKSNHTGLHYICITCHFVDENWKLQKRILRFRALTPPYDGASIANEIGIFLGQWKLDDKVLSITVDNATYNDVMISTLKRRLVPKGGLSCGESLFHIRCCAHVLNLVVQKGLSRIVAFLENIRTLVKIMTRSSLRTHEFYDCADKIFQLDVSRRLKLDMPVRWNSTYKLLETAIYFKDVLIDLSRNEPYSSHVPSVDEWDKVTVTQNFLRLFYEVTCMFSASKTPTANIYFKGAWMVHRHLLEAQNGPYDYLKDMVGPMLNQFRKYWSEYNLYLSCAAILDPRFKVKFVEYCLTKVFGRAEALMKVDVVLNTLNILFNDYKLRYGGSSPVVTFPSPSIPVGDVDYFDDYDHFVGSSTGTQVGKSKLQMYLDESPLDRNMELDVLEFWHQNTVRYPVLSLMARDLLCIPVSTVASESAFSLGGKIVSASRSSLKSKTIQALVCLQDWGRASVSTNRDEERLDSNLEELMIDKEEEDDEEDDIESFF